MIYRAALLTFLLAARLTAATLPGGFYVMQPLRGNNPPLTDKVVSSPQLAGVHVRDKWQLVEPKKGQYDFTWLSDQLNRAARLGKKVTLGIYAGTATDPATNDIASFTQMVGSLGKTFGGNTAVAAVHISAPQVTNESMEMYLPSSWKGGDAAAISIWKQSIDAFAKAFPSTPLVLDIAMAGKNGAITKAVDDYAWATLGASRISYIVCNLKDTTNTSADHIQELVRMRDKGAHIGFEFVGPSGNSRFRNFAKGLSIGQSLGGDFFQLYQGDIGKIPATAALYASGTPEPSSFAFIAIWAGIFCCWRWRNT